MINLLTVLAVLLVAFLVVALTSKRLPPPQ